MGTVTSCGTNCVWADRLYTRWRNQSDHSRPSVIVKTNSARPLRAEYQPTPAPAPEPVHGWRLFILVLSVYVLGELFVEATVPLAPEVINLLEALDTAIC